LTALLALPTKPVSKVLITLAQLLHAHQEEPNALPLEVSVYQMFALLFHAHPQEPNALLLVVSVYQMFALSAMEPTHALLVLAIIALPEFVPCLTAILALPTKPVSKVLIALAQLLHAHPQEPNALLLVVSVYQMFALSAMEPTHAQLVLAIIVCPEFVPSLTAILALPTKPVSKIQMPHAKLLHAHPQEPNALPLEVSVYQMFALSAMEPTHALLVLAIIACPEFVPSLNALLALSTRPVSKLLITLAQLLHAQQEEPNA